MKTRHYFASANTNDNFINYFDYILDNSTQSFRYIIKGSSGCGKSTLMKKISNYFQEQGYYIENFYCSSDPSSLDGIRIVSPNICIVDGTSPHATEAKIPGVSDKIINLGEFIDDNVAKNSIIIKEILKEKSRNYSKIYLYLQAIGNLDKIIRSNYLNYSNDEISSCILSNCATSFKKGNLRKLFITALDKNGITDLTDKNNFTKNYLPVNKYEFSEIIEGFYSKILEQGNDVTLFYDIFSSNKIIGILINDKNYYTFTKEIPLEKNEQDIQNKIKQLINMASKTLSQTRKIHFELEKQYSNFINFDGLSDTYEKIKIDIQKRIDKNKNFN